MKKVAIMQPYFFPYIGYWQLVSHVNRYIVYDDINFIKGGWINRNKILINNVPSFINIEMKGASPNKLINEIEVSSNKIKRKKLLKTIEMSYKKSPNFGSTFELLEKIILYEESNLALYLFNSIKKISRHLEIETEILLSSDIKKNNLLRGEEKIIQICKKLNADSYCNAIGGLELYSKENFRNNRINLEFLKTKEIKYEQFGKDFIPNLSIIDVMMFNSPEKINQMLGEYELI